MAKAAVDKKQGGNRIIEYFRETWYEVKRTSWPTRSEAINLTIIVVAVTTFLAIILGLLDWLFTAGFGLFL